MIHCTTAVASCAIIVRQTADRRTDGQKTADRQQTEIREGDALVAAERVLAGAALAGALFAQLRAGRGYAFVDVDAHVVALRILVAGHHPARPARAAEARKRVYALRSAVHRAASTWCA